MSAIVANQHSPLTKAQRKQLLRNGKTKMQVLDAGTRKLVHICFGVIKHQKRTLTTIQLKGLWWYLHVTISCG